MSTELKKIKIRQGAYATVHKCYWKKYLFAVKEINLKEKKFVIAYI